MTDTGKCPCRSGMGYMECCGVAHTGQRKAATAEALMRSRYCAYILGDIPYLLRTWHPSTRPAVIDPAAIPDWRGLDILRAEEGQEGDNQGIVEFRATALSQGKFFTLHEVSRFVREAGQWLYVSGDITPDSAQAASAVPNKAGRNSPCPCGSGKKFKKCCAGVPASIFQGGHKA